MKYKELTDIIMNAEKIVFFGGAGVSTASGIPDFRSANGLYSGKKKSAYTPEEMLSHDFFLYHTKEFYDFYRTSMIYRDAKPNGAHRALAALEKAGLLTAVVTQNIDGLHQLAGSRNVIELHGTVLKNHCMRCGRSFSLDYVMESNGTPECDECGGIVKPDVVLYGEMLDDTAWSMAEKYISEADVMIVGGTSLTVYPAASLVRYFKGRHLVLLNAAKTPYDDMAELVIRDNLADVLDQAVKDAGFQEKE